MSRRLTRRALPGHSDDGGFTLTEVVVAMGLLMIFMSIFTTVTLMMTNATTKVQRISEAVTQANQAFIALDKTVRYATAISTPDRSTNGTWHVEFNTSVITDGTASDMCTQLRIVNQQLQQRTWTVSGATYASGSLSAWKPLSNYVLNGSVANVDPDAGATDNRPFTTPSANPAAASRFQRLTVTIIAAGDPNTTSLTDPNANRASMTFAAVNSVVGSTASVCQQVAVDSTS